MPDESEDHGEQFSPLTEPNGIKGEADWNKIALVCVLPLITTKARTIDQENPQQHHCVFCRLPVELRVSILGYATEYEDIMSWRSTCACLYTASNSAESTLTFEFLTENYLTYNLDIVKNAYVYQSFTKEPEDYHDPDKLLQMYREYMEFGVCDLRKNKKFADIMDIQKHYISTLALRSECNRHFFKHISVDRLRQIFLYGQAKPKHEICGLVIDIKDITDFVLNSYRVRLFQIISNSCSDFEHFRTLKREFDAISSFAS